MSKVDFWDALRLISIIILVVSLWGGVSFNGHHFGCSCSKGLEFNTP